MIVSFAWRMLTEVDKRALWKFLYNFGYQGMRSVQRHKKRLRRGVYFPPFLFLSIINSCQLRCKGCWVDVASPRQMIHRDDLNRVIREARQHGNRFFGILGGEPLLHPDLLDVLASHPDCYFQIFTNGHAMTDEIAERLRQLGNATPLVSIEGGVVASDDRRGRHDVLHRTLAGLEACVRHRLVVGVATSLCQTNIDLVDEAWLRRLIEMGVHYAWFYTYRPVGPTPAVELALTPEQLLRVRRFLVKMRTKLPIGIVDAYWDAEGRALCPMIMGISHHIGPSGAIEPCPVIQFAKESIYCRKTLYELLTDSAFLRDFRFAAGQATRGCVLLERPDLVRQLVAKHAAVDTTQRGTALVELDAMQPRSSQHAPDHEIPEEHWLYRFAKRHWFFGFGAYS
jgi:MoaA/NifB/PqqE/SkfB family radical SAM enzyme